MFYYITVGYDMDNYCIDNDSTMKGPFETPELREEALRKDLGSEDLETSTRMNVTLLKIQDGELIKEKSFEADTDEYPPDWAEDEFYCDPPTKETNPE